VLVYYIINQPEIITLKKKICEIQECFEFCLEELQNLSKFLMPMGATVQVCSKKYKF
jgi:hypothetical protein